jgi:hypothetical protein
MGHPAAAPHNPLSNPVNRALTELRDAGAVHSHEPDWGDPTFSVSTNPETTAASPGTAAPYTLDDHKAFRQAMREGTVTTDDIKSQFARMRDSRNGIIADLHDRYNAKQLQAVAANLGNFGAKRQTKAENATACYRSLLRMFHLGDSLRYNPMQESLEDALLEPSAGKGDILDAIHSEMNGQVTVNALELNRTLQDVLEAKGHEVEFADFLEHRGQ